MSGKLTTEDLFQMFSGLIRRKDQICSVLGYINVEELDEGIIGIHQDIFNDSLKYAIKEKLGVEDFDIKFSGDCISVTAEKFVKAMMIEKVIIIKIKFYNIDLNFANGQYYLTVDYLTGFEGIPSVVEKMPGGNALKEMLVNSVIRHKIKDADWIDIKGDRIYMDFSRIEAFGKLRQNGVFGVDVLNETELFYYGTRNEELQFSFRTK